MLPMWVLKTTTFYITKKILLNRGKSKFDLTKKITTKRQERNKKTTTTWEILKIITKYIEENVNNSEKPAAGITY